MKLAVRSLSLPIAIAALAGCIATIPVDHLGDHTRPVLVVRQGIFDTNSVDGQIYAIEILNNSTETIKYVRVRARAFNRVGDPVADSISGRIDGEGEMVGPLEPRSVNRPSLALLVWKFDSMCQIGLNLLLCG